MIAIVDDFLFDRVFQPISNWVYDRTGVEPQEIANFFAAGFVFCDVVETYLRLDSDPFTLSIRGLSVIGVLLLAMIIVMPAPGRYANRKRYFLIYLRVFELGTLVLNTVLLPLYIMEYGAVISLLHLTTNLFYVIGLYFAAVDQPPPRQFVAPKSMEMAP